MGRYTKGRFKKKYKKKKKKYNRIKRLAARGGIRL